MKEKILVTGSAGFIGFHLSKRLLEDGYEVVGVDNLNDYYEISLKEARNAILKKHPDYSFYKGGIEELDFLQDIFSRHQFDYVVNLAAQAGVRYSLENPFAYTASNITGFVNVLEKAKDFKLKHVVYASSSSVYGANTTMPFSEDHHTEHPVSLYAATKKANEMIAHSYAHNYGLPVTGLRFFTVYGPWGRPDMAIFKFTRAILNDDPIEVYNNGKMMRDFTCVDDIIEGILRVIPEQPTPDSSWTGEMPNPAISYLPYRIYNIGNNEPVPLMSFIKALESAIGKKASISFKPLQSGDVLNTFAKVDRLDAAVGYKPHTELEWGVKEFVKWYTEYYSCG